MPIFESRLPATHFTVALVVELEVEVVLTVLLDECVEFVFNDDDDVLSFVNEPCSFL